MIYTIQNAQLRASIHTKGAELQSLFNKTTGLEYMWSGDAAFWGKKSPVLFPVVGGLKNNNYQYKGNSYTLGRHGFAREMDFTVTAQTDDSITFSLESNEETLAKYPFTFIFSLQYTLIENSLQVQYTVENTGTEEMYFSVGAHPAFKVPLSSNTRFEDYYLQFNHTENGGRWPLTADGLIKTTPNNYFNNSNRISLTKALFYEDALVFKHLQSESISILSNTTQHGITVSYQQFPFMGIWNAKDADFVCIEPWCGIADSENTTGELSEKEGINVLAASQLFKRSWQVSTF
jgi:galactose mutarotase-like enzyme